MNEVSYEEAEVAILVLSLSRIQRRDRNPQ